MRTALFDLLGAFVGLFWGVLIGFVAGWFVPFVRNLVIAIRVFTIRGKADLAQSRDFRTTSEATMPEREQRALKTAVEDSNEKAWAIGLGLTLAFGLFAATNVLILKGGSNVGLHLQLLRVYLPGYSVTFAGSVIPFIYAFVLGCLSGRTVIALYHRFAGWIG